jgi:hypothetical protein
LLAEGVLKFASQVRIVYYYCSGSSSDQSRPGYKSILRNLISQLAWKDDWTVAPALQTAYQVHCEKIKYHDSTELSITQWERLLSDLISANDHDEGVVILVDGVDECGRQDINSLLKLSKILVSEHTKLRLMLSSQEHVDIAAWFPAGSLSTILASAATTKEDMQISS